MKIMKQYKTKAKWSLGVAGGFPLLGYYCDGKPYHLSRSNPYKMLPKGENLLMQGYIRPTNVARGRSSVTFEFQDHSCNGFGFAASGTLKLLELIAAGQVTVHPKTGEFFGWWTFMKQGTEVSTMPLYNSEADEIMS